MGGRAMVERFLESLGNRRVAHGGAAIGENWAIPGIVRLPNWRKQ